MASRQYSRGKTSGAKAANAEFLAADIVVAVEDGHSTTLKVSIVPNTTAPRIEMSIDSGVTWFAIDGGAVLPVDQLTIIEIPGLDGTETITFRTPTVGGTTLNYFRVDEFPF